MKNGYRCGLLAKRVYVDKYEPRYVEAAVNRKSAIIRISDVIVKKKGR